MFDTEARLGYPYSHKSSGLMSSSSSSAVVRDPRFSIAIQKRNMMIFLQNMAELDWLSSGYVGGSNKRSVWRYP